MTGLADLLFGAQNPFSQFVDQNAGTIHQAGAGFASGLNFGDALSGAAKGAAQGQQYQNAYALQLADQKQRQDQIAYERTLQQNALQLQSDQRKSTANWAIQNGHPEWAGPIMSGAISGSDIFGQMYKPGTVIPQGGGYIPNQLSYDPGASGGAASGAISVPSVGGGAPTTTVAGMPKGYIQLPPAPAPGYRNNPDGTQSFIPGGQGDPATIAAQNTATERAKANAAKPEQKVAAATSLAQLKQSDQLVTGFIDKAIQQSDGLGATGWVGKLSEQVPGSPAYALAKTLDTVKANIGFDKLAAMRAASPSGGALGQVSNFEEQLLQSVLGSLDQGQDAATIKQNLTRLKDYMAVNDAQRLQAFNQDFGNAQMPAGGSGQPANGSTTSIGVQWSFAP